jgi:hypothetical protein
VNWDERKKLLRPLEDRVSLITPNWGHLAGGFLMGKSRKEIDTVNGNLADSVICCSSEESGEKQNNRHPQREVSD